MRKLFYLSFVFALLSCEQDVVVDLPQATAPVAIDAFLYHKAEPQIIDLTTANTYFDSSDPIPILGANVTVTDLDNGRMYTFDQTESGQYIWDPFAPTDTFGIVGNNYFLSIEANGQVYESVSTLNPVPPVDSITWRLEEGDAFSDGDFFIGEFWARDLIGEGDTYWIKSWKNGQLLNKPNEINIAYDAAFSDGDNSDGLTFITPIRDAISPFEFDDDDVLIDPFVPGDSVFVEINSITQDAFFFLRSARDQIDRPGGFGELFAIPLANTQSNISSQNPNEKVVGFFCVSATSSLGRRFTEEAIFQR